MHDGKKRMAQTISWKHTSESKDIVVEYISVYKFIVSARDLPRNGIPARLLYTKILNWHHAHYKRVRNQLHAPRHWCSCLCCLRLLVDQTTAQSTQRIRMMKHGLLADFLSPWGGRRPDNIEYENVGISCMNCKIPTKIIRFTEKKYNGRKVGTSRTRSSMGAIMRRRDMVIMKQHF